ncbi:DNA double-strand break repair nuclease NurA [Tellurirhabdus bombi]|uniref:DNA double-strand break repair nuclease NurA n=1 Tax=Tellurirhabdus bombi TaxID=2907205 RepID=UPI001F362FCE|nr:DNA double-strand break repair nuclease NurA [Tellurirhabdus bombi]
MNQIEIPSYAIDSVAKAINDTVNRPSQVTVRTIEGESETPHYFEIIPFDKIDESTINFFAIDGSYNFQEFYNGISIGVYTAGYVCFNEGKQIKLNDIDSAIIKGKNYFPKNIMITNDVDKYLIYDEFLELEPVKKFIEFIGNPEDWSGWADSNEKAREIICSNNSKLFSFCQAVLEWALVYEISNLDIIKSGDFILRDGNLRSLDIKQKYLIKLGKYLHEKNIYLVSITKNSAIKLHMSSAFRELDQYLQEDLKYKFQFTETEEAKRKICCWLEVTDYYLTKAFQNSMITKKSIKGGRGFGLYFVARLDYVEKLQNYDWLVADINIFDCIPNIENNDTTRDINKIEKIFLELTRLTQEHYILGYPYPLTEAHSFVSLKNTFKQEIINRVKIALYKDLRMEHVDIENMFLDIHDRF